MTWINRRPGPSPQAAGTLYDAILELATATSKRRLQFAAAF